MNTVNCNSPVTIRKTLIGEIWRFISGLGINSEDSTTEKRSFSVSNQINYILGISMAVLGLILLVRLKIQEIPVGLGYLRVWYTFILCFLNLGLAYFKLNQASKASLIFLSPLVFVIFPIMSGFVEDEGFTYNAYVLIAASIIPQLVLNSEKEKFLFWLSMSYYLILVLLIDFLAYTFNPVESKIAGEIKEFYFIYKLAHFMVFFFINVSIYSLRKANFRFEDKLNVKNQILNDQNCKLHENSLKILQQKEIIEQHSLSINDSINYAAMIQQAVLQPPDFMNEWDLENFILYKPKAVVSGDFYWGITKNDSVIIVAADSTGHGIPGAFMSMLGLAFLDDIYNNGDTLTSAEYLDKLRELVINKLKKKGTSHEMRDGMDISMCIINKLTMKLEFAGANNPLYLIRNGSLTKIDADKMPIGIYSTTQVPFRNNIIDLKNNDRIYMFSDGYADQFGGINGKKLMYKQFQELLVQNHNKPMTEQKLFLDNYFEEWKGDRVQIDDVLVMGIKI
jgi:serine phosphatase RsbU (regulator of sigma subunit)